VIARLVKWLQIESPQLTAKFLQKQIVLVTNLAGKYWSKAKIQSWANLKTTLAEKNQFLANIIGTNDELTALLADLCSSLENNLKVP